LKAIFIYDADCGFCAATVRWLRDRGAEARIDFQAYQQKPSAMAAAGLTVEDCQRAAYAVELGGSPPRVYRGAAAVNFALRKLPGARHVGWRLIGRLYTLPTVRQAEDAGYAWVARNRRRLSRSGQVCAVR
jgi:predicted DCC family thiol-disulfide oxidoreductase YuxK